MTSSRASRSAGGLLAAAALLAAPLLPPGLARPLDAVTEPLELGGDVGLTPPPAPWPAAAEAVRRSEPAAARRLIEPLAGGRGVAAGEARLVLGLWAQLAGEPEACARWLHDAGSARGRFEDWRLLVLADCHAETERLPAAAATLHLLLDRHPGSPLRNTAILRAAQVARQQGDRQSVLALTALGRRQGLDDEQAAELEQVAWEIAVASGDQTLQRQIARHLLVHLPILASQLEVIELFRQPSGALDWRAFLGVGELFERARSLLGAGVTAGALEALDAVPASRRDLEWSLLRAEVLTAARRGIEALALLGGLQASSRSAAVRIESLRAAAALEAVRAQPGRSLSAADRDHLHATAHASLWRVLELAGDDPAHRPAALSAHRRLLDVLLEEELVEPALALLRTLRRLDPDDSSGARFLWRSGWREYQRRNYTGAIGYWSELETIYPATGFARSGRYWTARAHELLGERQRAEAIYREVASVGTEDFYRRHALARLDADPLARAAAAPAAPREPWPWDPALERARWLSDRGLDELALIEIAGQAAASEPRAAAAFEAVVLARLGRRRDSIHAISRAFPQLGTLQQDSAPATALRLYYPNAYRTLVQRFAADQRIPAPLLFAMIRQESAFDPQAVSRSGARGLMQLMPATGRQLAERLRLRYSTPRLADPEFNIRLGSSYFRQLLEMFDGNEELALAGYNGGPYRIKRLWRSEGSAAELDRFVEGLALEETRRYVKRILLFRDSYQRLYPDAA